MKSQMKQRGQALVEGLLAMLVLVSIWVAVAWLGNLQDMALTAQHASRHAAFSYTRNPATYSIKDIRRQYFLGPAHQWNERSGNSMLASPLDQISLNWDRSSILVQSAQVGGTNPLARELRNDWGLLDKGIVRAQVYVTPGAKPVNLVSDSAVPASVLGLEDFNHYPQLSRQTSILEGAGHAANDALAQQIVAQSALAWSDSAQASRMAGMKIDSVMTSIDAPWHRERPVFDWLGPWAGYVPEARLGHSTKEP
ncbi:hypothetical protein H0A65_01280 [Alcaligenaceae bacterium]|nr:hypothetical protein [Alcaligenaceae bacterium]